LTFKSKNVLLECAVNQFLKSPKSLIVIFKRLTGSHFSEATCACLPNYRHLPRKHINQLDVSSKKKLNSEFVNTCNMELWF